jgi:hypothetical protein
MTPRRMSDPSEVSWMDIAVPVGCAGLILYCVLQMSWQSLTRPNHWIQQAVFRVFHETTLAQQLETAPGNP